MSISLPTFALGSAESTVDVPGDVVSRAPHGKVPNATELRCAVSEGEILLCFWHEQLHEVIYQTPLDDPSAVLERNALLFDAYGQGHAWNEILDNGFGKTYRRDDMECFALWSYVMDVNTFGTMAFHEVRWG